MNKAELVNTLAGRLGGNKKAAGEALDAVIDGLERTVDDRHRQWLQAIAFDRERPVAGPARGDHQAPSGDLARDRRGPSH